MINTNNGEILDDEGYYLYGPFTLTVGETYTFAKESGIFWIDFYNEDGSFPGYGHRIAFGVNTENKTFTAEYPVCYVMSNANASDKGVKFVKGDSVPTDEETEVFF